MTEVDGKAMDDTLRLAVLIDAENAQASIVGELLGEIAKIGVATVRRIYGDFTDQALASWRECLLGHAIQPIQQFRNTTGKNATDSALIIDAMDLLHSKRFDGFCIVSSDSDFTRLATRIREEGMRVYGFGEQKTPKSFVAACDRFIYTEVLRPPTGAKLAQGRNGATIAAPGAPLQAQDAQLFEMLRSAVEASADETGWAFLGQVGSYLGKQHSDFDPRNYGHRKLTSLFEAVGAFDMRRRDTEGGSSVVFVKAKAD